MTIPTPAAPVVSVAIPSWNGRSHLETCFEALETQDDPGVPWEVCVLDNGSTDGTSEWVAREHPEVRLERSDVNLGFCRGYNRLIGSARGRLVALLNNDTRPETSWLGELVGALESAPSDVAAVSGVIVGWAGDRLDFARGAVTFDGHAFQLDFGRPLSGVTLPRAGDELPFGCGGNMLIRKEAFLSAGGFDEDYFAYLEDVDLGWRLWSGGERIVSAPGARVRHRSSATSDLLGIYNRGFLFERNAFLTAYKNFDAELWGKLMPAVLLTLASRTQTMLRENNPNSTTLGIDPYAGWIANTPGRPSGASGEAPAPRSPSFLGRAARRLRREALRLLGGGEGSRGDGRYPILTDERTIAQFRALSYLLSHMDSAAEKRAAVAARRRRPDREILARFPLYVVPTYPGDGALFSGAGFRSFLPADVPLVHRTLAEVMEIGG